MRFFTSLRYVQNDNTLALDEVFLSVSEEPTNGSSPKVIS